jgi:hypothetical protein
MALTNGLVVMTPTSIATGGGSGTINADGSVSFSSAYDVTLNGVFNSSYDNYMVSITSYANTTGAYNYAARLRSSGSDIASNYTHQIISAYGGVIGVGLGASQTFLRWGQVASTYWCGHTIYLFGPYTNSTTNVRSLDLNSENNKRIYDCAAYLDSSASCDGFKFGVEGFSASTITGHITVFGFNK